MYSLDSGTGDVTQIGSTLTSVNGVSVVKAYKVSADSTFTKFTFALTTDYGNARDLIYNVYCILVYA